MLTTCDLGPWLEQGAKALREACVEQPRREARLLLSSVGVPYSDVVAGWTEVLWLPDAYRDALSRRCAREPFAYIVGVQEFWGLSFHVSDGVLIPRPETETLIEAVLNLDLAHDMRILDLGVGSGCLLLTLLHLYPQALGVGVDLSRTALGLAQKNAFALGVQARCTFVHEPWGEELCASSFDLVVSNPPYIRTRDLACLEPEVVDFENMLALDGGEDGLDSYRTLLPESHRLLKTEGYCVLEVGHDQKTSVASLLQGHGLELEDVREDLAGHPRCLVSRKKRLFLPRRRV